MSGFTLHTSSSAIHSPALRIIYEGVSELAQEGHMPRPGLYLPVRSSDEVVYAMSGPGDLIGVLCFTLAPAADEIEFTLAYVEPSSRRMGVLRAMLNHVNERFKDGKLKYRVEVHEDNKLALQIANSMKFKRQVSSYTLDVR